MSVEAISWACRQTVGKSSAKFVLVSMANYADAQGFAWPSTALIAQVSEMDRKTVLSAIAFLRDKGFLIDTGDRKGGTKSVTVYRMPVESDIQSSAEIGTAKKVEAVPETERLSSPKNGIGPKNGAVPNFPGSSTKFPQKLSQKRDTEPSGTVKEPSLKVLRPDDVVAELWSEWVAHRKTKRAAVTDGVLKSFRREAGKANYTLAQALRKSIDRGWTGFESEWVARESRQAAQPMTSKNFREGVGDDGRIH